MEILSTYFLEKRIEDLEKFVKEREEMHKLDFIELGNLIFNGAQTHSSILRCEVKYKELEEKFYQLKDDYIHFKLSFPNMNIINNRIDELEEKCNSKDNTFKSNLTPHKCPICNGNGENRSEFLLYFPPNWPTCKS